MTRIEVALVGPIVQERDWWNLDTDWYERASAEENARSWDERQRVILDVEPGQTISQIFDRVIAETGLWEADWNSWVYGGSDSEPGARTRRFMALRDDASPIPLLERLSKELILVDESGKALWWRDHYDVTYAELRRAAEAGAVPGDPDQIYLRVRFDPAGGGLWHPWELLIQAWDEAWHVVFGLAAINEAHDLFEKVRGRLAGRDVVNRRATEWLRRNGYPDTLAYMLRGEPWSPRDLAGLLGCTTSEAEGMLALYGYERGADGTRWQYAGGNDDLDMPVIDLSAQVMVVYAETVWGRYLDSKDAPAKELRALFNEILRQASETGQIGSLDHVPWDKERVVRIPARARVRETLRQLLRRNRH